MTTPILTDVHALTMYHLAYNNQLYSTACDAIATMLKTDDAQSLDDSKAHPNYTKLSNLLTDAALEICGHPAYGGVGWTLAQELRALVDAQQSQLDANQINQLYAAIESYFAPFHTRKAEFHDLLETDVNANTGYLIELAMLITDEAVRSASTVASWQGRTAYHLLAACAGYLTTTSILFRYVASTNGSTLNYAAEKFGRALRDTLYGLNELSQQLTLPTLFLQARDSLRKLLGED